MTAGTLVGILTAHLTDLAWDALPTEITPKRKKGAKIDSDLIRQKLRDHKPCRIVIDGPRRIGRTTTLLHL